MQYFGKEYAEVKDRIPIFRSRYPDWSIITKPEWFKPDMSAILFHCLITGPNQQQFHGWAYEERVENTKDVNFSAWVENCETSAIGRALANMGLAGSSNNPVAGSTERPAAEEMGKVERALNAAHSVAREAAAPAEKSTKLVLLKKGDKSPKMEDALVKLEKTRETMKELIGHDQFYIQALANRKITEPAAVASIKTLEELQESLLEFLSGAAGLIQDASGKSSGTMRDVPADKRDGLNESLTKMALLV